MKANESFLKEMSSALEVKLWAPFLEVQTLSLSSLTGFNVVLGIEVLD